MQQRIPSYKHAMQQRIPSFQCSYHTEFKQNKVKNQKYLETNNMNINLHLINYTQNSIMCII
jgi:hypothetical protein